MKGQDANTPFLVSAGVTGLCSIVFLAVNWNWLGDISHKGVLWSAVPAFVLLVSLIGGLVGHAAWAVANPARTASKGPGSKAEHAGQGPEQPDLEAPD